MKNDSLEMPAGEEGVVIHSQRFSRRMHMTDDQKKSLKKDIEQSYEKDQNAARRSTSSSRWSPR